ncbi:MAG: GNAT family N-acetyltransferase [Gemmatimonadales bacterium]|nr:MAG: GNAT family N-acetyltransferase [Gemmatimonadales bacterium]
MEVTLPAGIGIRDLRTQPEFEACVRLQQATWGEGFGESVPAAILRVASRYGGVIAGAFAGGGPAAAQGEMIGFVFGLTGLDGGRPVHWSDMLAVLPPWRGRGVGTALKAWQRARLLELGVGEMRWSFDPLEAGNAALNLARLGAVGRWYEEDMYGVPSSPLHAGIGTDRLVVSWKLDAEARAPWVPGADPDTDPDTRVVRVPIPRNVQDLKARDPDEARRWRIRVRDALVPLLAEGGEVRGFEDPGAPAPPALLVVPPPGASHPPTGENLSGRNEPGNGDRP